MPIKLNLGIVCTRPCIYTQWTRTCVRPYNYILYNRKKGKEKGHHRHSEPLTVPSAVMDIHKNTSGQNVLLYFSFWLVYCVRQHIDTSAYFGRQRNIKYINSSHILIRGGINHLKYRHHVTACLCCCCVLVILVDHMGACTPMNKREWLLATVADYGGYSKWAESMLLFSFFFFFGFSYLFELLISSSRSLEAIDAISLNRSS